MNEPDDGGRAAPGEKPKPSFFRVGTSVITGGAVKAMTAVDLKVYLTLALHANWRTGRCWPSYRTIRELTGCSFDCIADAIRRLTDLGTISAQRDKVKRGRRNTYTVHRIPPPSPGICSERTEDPLANQNRDARGRFCSDRTEEVCSEQTEDLCSDGTEQNEIHLNEIHRTGSKESPPPPPGGGNGSGSKGPEPPTPRMEISEEVIRKLKKAIGKEAVLKELRKGNYPIPEFLLTEEEERARDILEEVLAR
jgi:hypothetical protein